MKEKNSQSEKNAQSVCQEKTEKKRFNLSAARVNSLLLMVYSS